MKIIDLKQASHHLMTLAHWHHEQWSDYNENVSQQQRIERMSAYLEDSYIPSTYIAVDSDDSLLGSAAIVKNDMATKPELTPWLASVFVKPSCRNLGVGSKLVKHMMLKSHQNGIDRLYLFTPDRVSFYLKLGWKIFGKERYQKHDVTVMKAELSELF